MTVTIPPALPAGTSHRFATADADGVVPETYEGNNANLSSVSVIVSF